MGNSIKEVQARVDELEKKVGVISEALAVLIERENRKSAEPKTKTNTKAKTLKEK